MLLLVLIFLFILVIAEFFMFCKKENFLNYKQCNNDKLHITLNQRIKRALNDDYKLDNKNWDIYMPCGYTYVEDEIKKIKFNNEEQSVFAIDGCDKLASKISLAKLLKKRYGDSYYNYIPRSYGNNKGDLTELLNNHREGLKYIAKKDIQQQKGLTIINDYKNVKDILKDKSIIVIQELLNNPFTINQHKINLRVYLLITCTNGIINAFIHKNGFMYYTPKKFDYLSTDNDSHITTGYIDRKIYENNPLTLEDFYKYLDLNGYKSKILINNIKNLYEKIISAVNPSICNRHMDKKNTLFQLFGTDVAPDNNLNVKLIEINKGPDMGGKDKRDNGVKDKVIKDTFQILKKNVDKDNQFIEIW